MQELLTPEQHLEKYIHISKYSRWRQNLGRRELEWSETVSRFKEFWLDRVTKKYPDMDADRMGRLKAAISLYSEEIVNKRAMPSMRAIMSAGKALERDEAAGFNCWAAAITHPKIFDELFYLLMCGGGVGWSVERQYIALLPPISEDHFVTDTVIVVSDSKIGWAKALRELMAMLWAGQLPGWDLSKIRPAGARLKTFGGRASGPEPLERLFKRVTSVMIQAAGRRLNSLECHDIMCSICSTVIVGSVRRSAGISFSNLTDDRMRKAKMGRWWEFSPDRQYANNSTAFTERPDMDSFLEEMLALYQSRAGERGIVNKVALKEKAVSCGREYKGDYLLNPCAEAILRDTGGCCNLSSVPVRPTDTLEDLANKVRVATFWGTLQSTLDGFRYLRPVWAANQKEERLLGVSLTGIQDHEVLRSERSAIKAGDWFCLEMANPVVGGFSLPEVLLYLKNVSRETNSYWADLLGIPRSLQLTLIKPEGTVSKLCSTSSGMHPRFAKYYIQRVTQDKKDPLTDMMIAEGIPHSLDAAGEKVYFAFPIKAPEGAVTADELGPIEQLETWLCYRRHWCEGNPSQTVYYTDKTFPLVQAWVWDHWDEIGGLSFFPKDDHIYDNAPWEKISEEKYEELISHFPNVDWGKITEFETEDCTTGSQELACAGGSCEM